MTISAIVLAITGVFGGGRSARGSTRKDEGWLDRLANAIKRLAGKAVELLPTIVGSVVGAILSFLGKAVGFVSGLFVAAFVGVWLMEKVKKG